MQIIIDIPSEMYDWYDNGFPDEDDAERLWQMVKNGTPLPKGHGRLIDADEVLNAMDTWDKFGYTETGCFVREPSNDYVPYVHYEDMIKAVSGTQTIIEAESEVN